MIFNKKTVGIIIAFVSLSVGYVFFIINIIKKMNKLMSKIVQNVLDCKVRV